MNEKKLTDEEIVKALKNASTGYGAGIVGNLWDLTLDLIDRQKAEIERLTEYNENLNGMCLEFIDKNAELQKQVDELKEERKNMQAEIIGLESQKEDLYFQNKNLQTYIDNHEPIWKRNTEQAVKDTAKEIFTDLLKEFSIRKSCGNADVVVKEMAHNKGVEVE